MEHEQARAEVRGRARRRRPAVRAVPAALVLASLALASCSATPEARAAPPATGARAADESSPRAYGVGFRTSWILDHGRRYASAFDHGATYGAEPAPRPILVNLWYPTDPALAADAMAHGDYLEIGAEEPELARFAAALAAHARAIVVEQVLGEPESELDGEERALLERLLAAPSACRRDAPPARGPFPLVVYHSGAGSSFEDNAYLCEELARRGYVVAGSAFPEADGSSLGVDAGRGSSEDMHALVRHAAGLAFVDARRVALVGHSAGAQAALKCAAQPGCPAGALVLLDTTQDYYTLSMPLHAPLVAEVLENVAQLDEPLLVAASPEATFALCDRLVAAERVYLTVPDLGHDEFIAQGLQRLDALERRADADPAERARAPGVRATYAAVCELVRLFLDAHLRDEPTDFDARIEACAAAPLGGDALGAELVPVGVSEPPTFDPQGVTPPTPRQFRVLFERSGAEEACAVLRRYREATPRSPIYSSTMLTGSLLYELATSGRAAEARILFAGLREIGLDSLSLFDFLIGVSLLQGWTETAQGFVRVARELDPEDARFVERERELAGSAGE